MSKRELEQKAQNMWYWHGDRPPHLAWPITLLLLLKAPVQYFAVMSVAGSGAVIDGKLNNPPSRSFESSH
jgi:hypothetical protein